ncbi:GlxA family transcriptional regulator [Rhodovulum sp. DZ06]|uniref:GlxA family transcriptional regulator n=1 Tax=Rhodovulum sp. DZ06 TaxID=3425126 RepID=UPI003D333C87
MQSGASQDTKPVVFVLLDRFTLLAFAASIEPLRLANRTAERSLYDLSVVSESGAPVTASCGVEIKVDGALPDCPSGAMIVVCGGTDVGRAVTRPLMNWLRREARRGVSLCAVDTGAQALAASGLLDGRKATIHWENREGFAEAFDEVELSSRIFVIDGERMTAAGGLAATDLMLRLISLQHGPELGSEVSDQMVYTAPRTDTENQRLSTPARIGVRHPKLSRVIALMHEHIEDPLSAAALAQAVGMSTRQLERLFRRYLDRSPKRYYLELRLEKARRLLLQTDMSVISVALACGFTSPSHFSKCYRSQYGRTPYRERGVVDADARGQSSGPRGATLVALPDGALEVEADDLPEDEDDDAEA